MSTGSSQKISDLQAVPTQVATDAFVQDLFNKHSSKLRPILTRRIQ